MTFEEYQKNSRKTAMYPAVGEKFVYPALGLAGETGEVLEKVKKICRDKGGKVDEETKQELSKEMGDVLWYLAQLATEFDLSFNDIAESNIKKLLSRLERGTIHGSGDNR